MFLRRFENLRRPFNPPGIISAKNSEKETIPLTHIFETPEAVRWHRNNVPFSECCVVFSLQAPIDIEGSFMDHEDLGSEMTVQGVLNSGRLSRSPDIETMRFEDVDHLSLIHI